MTKSPIWVLTVIELGLAAALVALLIGWRTTAASVAVTGLALLGYGLSYSFGKMDHNIRILLAPTVLACADWGRAVSVDGVRSSRTGHIPQWPVRLLALLIGMAFVTAAVFDAVAVWAAPRAFGNAQDLAAPAVVTAGAAVGLWYLTRQTHAVLRRRYPINLIV